MSERHHTFIGIILPQKQSVLGARRHHTVRLIAFFRHQVVDQHSGIPVRSLEYNRLFAENLLCGIDAGDDSLRRSLLIT